MRGLEKNYMKREHIYTYIDGHRDSMKESAKGRFFENVTKGVNTYIVRNIKKVDIQTKAHN